MLSNSTSIRPFMLQLPSSSDILKWITETPENTNEEIIVIIPANNGTTGFYRLFMKILNAKYHCPVWVVANSGHDIQPGQGAPKKILGLEDQTKQKLMFFKKYVPENARVTLIGHSIGCHMVMELLKDPSVERRVLKCCLLFPLIERLDEGAKGINMKKFEKFEPILMFFAWLLYILPTVISMNLMKAAKVPEKDIPFILSSCNPEVLKQVLYVAADELALIRKRDDVVLKKNMDKIRMLYEKNDGWLPVTCFDDMKKDLPEIKAEVSNFKHAFYFDTSLEVAEIVSKWISEDRQRYY